MCFNESYRAGDASVSCYMYEIPSFIEAELVKAYATFHSSMPFFKFCRSIDNVSCYVSSREGHPSTILLFAFHDKRVEVLNEMIEVEPQEIHRFASYIFQTFNKVDSIGFKALKTTTTDHLGFPVQQYRSKDTYVIALPETPQEYTGSLGKSTRARLLNEMNRFRRDFPSFTARFFVNEEVDESHIRDIIRFSENKINANGMKVSHDVEQILALARMCGFVGVLSINGRVCAGWINYQIGANYFGVVTGYDPQYEKYSIGKLCTYLTVCECIRRGGDKYYLGGGAFDYKQRMLGNVLSMDELNIYRSYGKMLMHLDVVAKAFVAAQVVRLKNVLHRHKQKIWAKSVFGCFYFFRNKLAQ
jgi:hypothetical protein